jgi:peroxiredoxin Q/BCP
VTHQGKRVSLADYRRKGWLVLFFYPKNGTSVCTKEACAFRDSYDQFTQAGADVIGISSDDEASHRAFAERYKLTFPLISDTDGTLRGNFPYPILLV